MTRKRNKKRINLKAFYAEEAKRWEEAKALGSKESLRFIQERLDRDAWSWTDFSIANAGLTVKLKEKATTDLEIILTAITFFRKMKGLMKAYDEQIEEMNQLDSYNSPSLRAYNNE
jgi:hypothetical protein